MIEELNCPRDMDGVSFREPADAIFGALGKRVHCWYEEDGLKICFDLRFREVDQKEERTAPYADDFVFHEDSRPSFGIRAELLDRDADTWRSQRPCSNL